MTNANNFSEIAPAKESAIEVQSTNVVPLAITADTQSAIAAFTARPSVAAIGSALSAVRDGFTFAYEHEKEFSTGQNFFGFLWNAGKAILGPLLYLLWFGLNTCMYGGRSPKLAPLLLQSGSR